MSEPTPLSAEAESFVRKYKADGNAAMLQATRLIDAQATEIAGLRGALEREKRSEWREGIVNVIDHEGNYLGCMGTATWAALQEEPDLVARNRELETFFAYEAGMLTEGQAMGLLGLDRLAFRVAYGDAHDRAALRGGSQP